MTAVPLINIGGIGPGRDDTANLNVLETYTLSVVRGGRRTGQRQSITDAATGSADLQEAGRSDRRQVAARQQRPLRPVRRQSHLQRQHPRLLDRGPRVRRPAPRRVRREPGRGVRPGQPESARAGERRAEHARRQERDDAGARSADQLPRRAATRSSAHGRRPASARARPRPGGSGGGTMVDDCPAGTPASPQPSPCFVPTAGLQRLGAAQSPAGAALRRRPRNDATTATARPDSRVGAEPAADFVPTQDCLGWVPPNHPAARIGCGGGATPAASSRRSRVSVTRW